MIAATAKPQASYACHVDVDKGEQPDGCVLDYGTPYDCTFGVFASGRVRRSKRTCPHWRKTDGKTSVIAANKSVRTSQ